MTDLSILNDKSTTDLKASLENLLSGYMSPAFGALPKLEIEILFLNTLIELGYIDENPSIYDMVTKLKITKTKARNLLYERELRAMDAQTLDSRMYELLKHPRYEKTKNNVVLLEVENPLLSDHIRNKIQSLGFISNETFSPSLIKLSHKAISALIGSLYNDQELLNLKRRIDGDRGIQDCIANHESISIDENLPPVEGSLELFTDLLDLCSIEYAKEKFQELMGYLVDKNIDGLINKITEVIQNIPS